MGLTGQQSSAVDQKLNERLLPLGPRFPLVAGTVMAAVAVIAALLSDYALGTLLMVLLAVLAVHLGGHWWVRRGGPVDAVNRILRLTNLTGYTLVVLYSDALYSPLIPLYAEDILSASLRLGRRGAWQGWWLVTTALLLVGAGAWPLTGDEVVRLVVYIAVMAVLALIAGELGQQRLQMQVFLSQQVAENARLCVELEQQSRSLARAYEDLKALDQHRARFVQRASHELRTPLFFIRSYLDLMLDGGLGELSDIQREKLQILADKTRLLAALVGDIVSLQEKQTRSPCFTDLSLADLMLRAAHSAEAMGLGRAIALQVEIQDDLTVRGDPRQLEEVFDNLLSNAIKFSPDGGTITLSARRQGDQALVMVADQGIGIPPAEQERIFECFYRVEHSLSPRFEGSGLGLSIVQEIIQSHGGRVWVQSPTFTDGSGRGSTFYFTLPLAQTCRPSVEAAQAHEH